MFDELPEKRSIRVRPLKSLVACHVVGRHSARQVAERIKQRPRIFAPPTGAITRVLDVFRPNRELFWGITHGSQTNEGLQLVVDRVRVAIHQPAVPSEFPRQILLIEEEDLPQWGGRGSRSPAGTTGALPTGARGPNGTTGTLSRSSRSPTGTTGALTHRRGERAGAAGRARRSLLETTAKLAQEGTFPFRDRGRGPDLFDPEDR